MENFIRVYDGSLSDKKCKSIIKWFEKSKKFHDDGQIRVPAGNIVNKSVKDSTDIRAKMNSDWFPSQDIFTCLRECISQYLNEFSFLDTIDKFNLDSDYNIQRYLPNQGFYKEHCEHMTKESKRVLAWTLYLNDVTDGGETLYTLYDKKIEAKQGRMVIFPSYWTHAHRGIISTTQKKYICTGWFSFV